MGSQNDLRNSILKKAEESKILESKPETRVLPLESSGLMYDWEKQHLKVKHFKARKDHHSPLV